MKISLIIISTMCIIFGVYEFCSSIFSKRYYLKKKRLSQYSDKKSEFQDENILPAPKASDFAYYITSIMKVDKIKLNALLFYIQAASLVRNDKVAFDDKIICKMFCPEILDVDKHIIEKHGISYYKGKPRKLSYDDVKLADLVLGCFGDLTSNELIAIIHSENPWQISYNSTSFDFEIYPNDMKEYYKKIFEFK